MSSSRLFLGLIVVALAGGGYYYYDKNKTPAQAETTVNGSVVTSVINNPAAVAAQTPEARSSISLTNEQTPVVSEFASVAPPSPPVKAWMVFDATSNQIIGNVEPDMKLAPASLTKLMTASLVFAALDDKRISLDQMVTVSEKAWKTGGSRMFIEVNKQVSVGDLLQGMIVQSGNDATIQLAEVVAGSEGVFVGQMNQEAKAFGMNNTSFGDPTGLPSPDTYTTVRDLSVLAQHIIKDHPSYYHYFSQPEFTFNKIRQPNRNGLLYRNIGVDGLKTGHTDEAGYGLISTALRDGRRIITIVVGADSVRAREQISQTLLDWGFQNFSDKTVAEAGKPLVQPRVWEGETKQVNLGSLNPVIVTVPRGQENAVQVVTQYNGKLVAPLAKGQTVGNVQFVLDGKILKEEPLVVTEAVAQAGFVGRMWDKLLGMF
ncbi:MAG: D-alanyl-D-alanine carboxypeptidase family protein [Advenella sp.]|nr:D-alanyl-D-alanine carboxypeptidase family protein [Advenella sp.]